MRAAGLLLLGAAGAVRVDPTTSTFRDDANRTVLWRGVNYVNKGAPYYPTIDQGTVAELRAVGANVVRLGVMMPGVFPWPNRSADEAYLAKVDEAIDLLWSAGVWTIVDLHQDVLAHKVCGEGLPDWMVDVPSLGALPIPEPLSFSNASRGVCAAVGPLKFIGWSELYMTDACGKAFQQIYDGVGLMAEMFEAYWSTVAARYRGRAGVLAYELMNEPWFGDLLKHPTLLLGGAAERGGVGEYMSRMHKVVRAADPDTLVLFAPAELNNRLMRKVGYEAGFLNDPAGAAMAWHIYCITGTDAAGPTTWFTKALCHVNDGLQKSKRDADVRRLRTAGFVTEFGGVSDSSTGRAEVRYVAEKMDAMDPPVSWAYWAGVPGSDAYRREIARTYPRAVAGDIRAMSFDAGTGEFRLTYTAAGAGRSELFLASALHYPNGTAVDVQPATCCTATPRADGLLIDHSADCSGRTVSVTVTRK